MKIKRFEAADMRSALREVQADLGPEAVILSTQTEAAGVCVIAALDYDAALLGPSREGPPETAKPASRAADTAWPAAAAPAPAAAPASAAPQSRPESRSESAPTRASEPAPSSAASAPRHGAATAAAFAPTATSPAAHASIFDEQRIAGPERELAAVHRLLAERLPAKLGKQLGQGPQKPTLLREIGLEEALITRLRAHCPEGSGNPDGRMLAELSRRLDALARPQTPRCLALVGPTGAGKTTTAAKLAAQHLMAHRGSRVRLICTDTYRIGGREQLQSYARLMGLSVELADDPEHLAACVAETGPQDLLLVDTPGIGPRDAELAQQLPRLAGIEGLSVLLCLPAPTPLAELRRIVTRYAPAAPQAAILTKVDESTLLGTALSVALDAALAPLWITDGQRVPQDLARLAGRELVARALAQREQTPPIEPTAAAQPTTPAAETADACA